MTVCLIALRRERFEIYSEPPEEPLTPPDGADGRFRRWAHAATVRWRDLVEMARQDRGSGRLARGRNALVSHLAETIAEQRTLWALRKDREATLLFPATMTEEQARTRLDGVLSASRRHHGLWLAVDALLFAGSAVLAPIPGPNAIAYYLAFRVIGHLQSWRGANHAMTAVTWTFTPDADLAELAALLDLPRADRAPRLAEIASRLSLHRLPAYFERVAA